MNGTRIIAFLFSVLAFSWPVLLQQSFSPWFIWLYPFALWFAIMLLLFFIRGDKVISNKGHDD